MERQIGFDELQRALRVRIHPLSQRLRSYIAPVPLLLGGLVMFFDPTPWRRIVIGGALTLAVVLSVSEYRIATRREVKLKGALLVGAVLQSLVVLATGGVVSPVVVAMLVVGFAVSTLLDRGASRAVLFLQVGTIWLAMALEYSGVVGPLLPLPFRLPGHAISPIYLAAFALVETMVLFVTSQLGWHIQQNFGELVHSATRARDESLRLHHERLDELTQLSAEIAHELKNPLTSVKGLAALLARRELPEVAEPLGVLRREVDRMQATLEEFLNFSRPLVPLNVQQTDLSRLAAEVVQLHEGILESRQLTAEVRTAEEPVVECDPRKVQQILVNLLQNAIEASPRRGHIRIAIEPQADGFRVTVEDQGPGLDAAVAARVFEAGVTSKSHGSGLGLNVARGLARQHGGDINLQANDGGCTATVTLPTKPHQNLPREPAAPKLDPTAGGAP